MADTTRMIHLGLTAEAQERLLRDGPGAVATLAARFKLKEVNTDRLKMFGVLTAKTDDQHPERLEEADEVEFVEVDQERQAF